MTADRDADGYITMGQKILEQASEIAALRRRVATLEYALRIPPSEDSESGTP